VSESRVDFQTLKQIPAFRTFNESECHQIADVVQQRTFAPGEKVIEQGKRSQHLWIVLEGQCDVSRASLHDGPVVLATLEPYSLFGEMSFFSPAPHSASVVAKTPVKLLSISRPDYDDLIHDGVMVAYKLAYNAVESVANRLRRMDERIAELWEHPEPTSAAEPALPLALSAKRQSNPPPGKEKLPEWRQFRDKLFGDWNL
jgi:CRP-like cAMP-binding protein